MALVAPPVGHSTPESYTSLCPTAEATFKGQGSSLAAGRDKSLTLYQLPSGEPQQ